MAVGISFSMVEPKRRFVDRLQGALTPAVYAFFMRAGGAIRTTARRSLKRAKQKQLGELTDEQRGLYLARLTAFRRKEKLWHYGNQWGRVGDKKPRRPEVTAPKGRQPFLHSQQSPLRAQLFFSVAPGNEYLVVGPEAIGRNKRLTRSGQLTSVEELERNNPFMEPAYEAIEPRLPLYLQQSTKKVK